MPSAVPITPILADYILANSPPEHPELQWLRAETRKMPRAVMQISPDQGHLLVLLMQICGARRILEVGTFTGYSSLAMALALPPGGQIITCDRNSDCTALARAAWARAGVEERVDFRLGPAVKTLAALEAAGETESFDMIFIDANKEDYDAYYEASLRLVRRGALIILDNMLRNGRVTDVNSTDATVTCVRDLNAKIAADERGTRVLLPLRDGMTIVRRRVDG